VEEHRLSVSENCALLIFGAIRQRKLQDNEKDCTVKSFIKFIFINYYCIGQIKKNEIGGACSTHGSV